MKSDSCHSEYGTDAGFENEGMKLKLQMDTIHYWHVKTRYERKTVQTLWGVSPGLGPESRSFSSSCFVLSACNSELQQDMNVLSTVEEESIKVK